MFFGQFRSSKTFNSWVSAQHSFPLAQSLLFCPGITKGSSRCLKPVPWSTVLNEYILQSWSIGWPSGWPIGAIENDRNCLGDQPTGQVRQQLWRACLEWWYLHVKFCKGEPSRSQHRNHIVRDPKAWMQLKAMVGTTRCQHPSQFLQTGMNIPIAMSLSQICSTQTRLDSAPLASRSAHCGLRKAPGLRPALPQPSTRCSEADSARNQIEKFKTQRWKHCKSRSNLGLIHICNPHSLPPQCSLVRPYEMEK